MRQLIDNVTIVTMNQQMDVIENGYLLTDNDRILAIGSGSCDLSYDEKTDGNGGILMPGMVNTHCHVPMIPFRTLGDDCPDRLRRFLFPLEKEAMSPHLVYQATRYGICEMLLAGVTTFLDMYYFENQVAKACEELGIRGFLGQTVIGMETCDSPVPDGGLALAEEFIKNWKGHPLVSPLVAPHATNTCSRETLRKAHNLAETYDTLFTLHASEMDYEMEHFKNEYDMTPVEYLNSIDVLKGRTLAAHCIYTTEKDFQILKETDTTVSHCIGSNTKAGKGVAPVSDMIKHGISVGLGTDGPSSGNTLSMFTQFRLFASFHKTIYHDRGLFPASEIVSLGTMGGAKVLHYEDQIGSLEPGKKADVVLVERDSVQMFPCFNPYSALVYSADSSHVSMVMVNGEILVKEKQLLHASIKTEREKLLSYMGDFIQKAAKYEDV